MANIIPAESSGFETAGSVGDWTAWYGCTIAQTTDRASEGSGSLEVTPSGTFVGVSPDGAYPGWPASPGDHAVSVDAHTSLSVSSSTWTVTVTWRQGTTDLASETFTVSPGALGFDTGSITSTAPANTDALWLTIEADGTADTSATYYFDVIVADDGGGGGGQTVGIGQAVEVDSARPVTARKATRIGQAASAEVARPMTVTKTARIGQAVEADTARALRAARRLRIGQATETNTARPVRVGKTLHLGRAVERDFARPLTATGGFKLVPGTLTAGDAPAAALAAQHRPQATADDEPTATLTGAHRKHLAASDRPASTIEGEAT